MKEKNLDRRQNRSNKDGKKQLKVLFSVLLLCFMLAGIQACGSSAVPESVKESSINVSDITADQMPQGTEDTASSGTSEAESTVVNSQEESREAASKSEAESIAASKSEAESIAASKSEAESIAVSKSEAESIAASKSEAESIAASKSEAESIAASKSEAESIAASKSEAESIAASKSEAESIAASKSEAESIAASKSEAESKAAREASEAASRAEAEAAARTMPAQVTYVGNANTKKFHYPRCSSVDQMAEHNKVFFYGGREEPISQGYVPCKKCNP